MDEIRDNPASQRDADQGTWQAFLLFAGIAIMMILLARGASPSESLRLVQGGLEPNWWNNRVFFEIFLRSYQDSDGDGIGDDAQRGRRLC